MEPWFAALAHPTAAVPSAAAHNNALAWRTSRAGAVCERASPSSSTRCPPVISKAPAAATIPPTLTTDHYLSDAPLGHEHCEQLTSNGARCERISRMRFLRGWVG